MSKHKRGFLRSFISRGYKGLSILNTVAVLASGNPVKIVKHAQRKRMIRLTSGLIPGSKRR